MFICHSCLDDCEGPPILVAQASIVAGIGSYGPCEFCGKIEKCADLPSSAPWSRKQKADAPK